MTPAQIVAIGFVLLACAYSAYVERRLGKASRAEEVNRAALADLAVRHETRLAEVLQMIQTHDADYDRRYVLVMRAVALAEMSGIPAGWRIDHREPDWPVAYIELPTGQVSWHMPQHETDWDGHTTAEKYARIRDYARGVLVDATAIEL